MLDIYQNSRIAEAQAAAEHSKTKAERIAGHAEALEERVDKLALLN